MLCREYNTGSVPFVDFLVPEVYSAATSTLLESRRQGWREREIGRWQRMADAILVLCHTLLPAATLSDGLWKSLRRVSLDLRFGASP